MSHRGKPLRMRHRARCRALHTWRDLDSAAPEDDRCRATRFRRCEMSRAGALTCALFCFLVGLAPEKARAANWLELTFYLSGPRFEGVLPPCDYPDTLIKISSRFNERENGFWASDLQIVQFEKIRETAFRPWAANTIPR